MDAVEIEKRRARVEVAFAKGIISEDEREKMLKDLELKEHKHAE